MPAVNPIPTGPVPDTGQGMGLDMVPVIGDIRSGIMAVPTGRQDLAGMVAMGASAERVLHLGHRALAPRRQRMHPRSSEKKCEPGCHLEAAG